MSTPANLFPDDIQVANGRTILGDRPRNVLAEYSNALTPATVLTVRAGFSRVVFNLANQSLGFLPSTLGLPGILDTALRMFACFHNFRPRATSVSAAAIIATVRSIRTSPRLASAIPNEATY